MNQRTFSLLARMLAGECTDDEVKEIERMRSSNPTVSCFIDEVLKWWHPVAEQPDDESESAFKKIMQRIEAQNS